ncbi:ribokinase [Mycoplasmopsis agassizii]|uniref:Ribokinase n=2 Tax=Mycoplasmopsis agassizii TaxID=33922 RepID=A0ABX4H4L6_9BACT|nr:ribokinase [Mycoplasmopsis agassizii]
MSMNTYKKEPLKVLTIGSINWDHFINLDRFPNVGETMHARSYSESLGGKGLNQAIALNKLKVSSKFIAKIGEKDKDILLPHLIKNNLNLDEIEIVKNSFTGRAFIPVSEKGNNFIILTSGANANFANEKAIKYEEQILNSDIVLLQLEIDLNFVFDVLKLAKKHHKITILNPAPAIKLDEEIINLCDYLIPNETEFNLLFSDENLINETLENKLIKLKDKFQNTKIVVTYGEKGVFFLKENKLKNVEVIKGIKVVDTTAAGDSFISGFIKKISDHKTLEEAIIFANKVASISVTKNGSSESIPTLEEVEERFKNV